MKLLKRILNLWTLAGLDLSEVEMRVERKKNKQAVIVELDNPLDRIQI